MKPRLIVEQIDQVTKSILSEWPIAPEQEVVLGHFLGADLSKMEYWDCHEIDAPQMKALSGILDLGNGVTGRGRLRRFRPLDELPYKVHTGRELLLMLEGKKPIAVFSSPEEMGDQPFQEYVDRGYLELHEFRVKTKDGEYMNYLAYTRIDEGWRAGIFAILKDAGVKSGWSEGMERIEGRILGYEDWQNDVFIERCYRPSKNYGVGVI